MAAATWGITASPVEPGGEESDGDGGPGDAIADIPMDTVVVRANAVCLLHLNGIVHTCTVT
jgi:hypothetical protein